MMQKIPEQLEVVVASDASDDRTDEIVELERAHVIGTPVVAAQKTESQTDASGQPIESMPAKEN